MIELAAAPASSTSAWDEPGTLAFLIVFGLGVALYLLLRSMSRHLRKVNEAARAEAAAQEAAADATAGGPDTDTGGHMTASHAGNGTPPATS